MLKRETYETGSGTDAGAVIAKALKHQERYVKSVKLDRMPAHNAKGKQASPERDRYIIDIEYGMPERVL